MSKLILIFLGVICFLNLQAQTESTLYFMNSLPQVVETNPSVISPYKTVIGLPAISSVAAVYTNNGFSYSDLVAKTNGVSTVNLSQWTSNLADKNYLEMAVQTDLFRVGVYLNPKFYLMVSSTVKGYNRSMFQKGLANVLVDGNAPLVNSFSNTSPEEEAISMIETNVGLAYKMNQKLTIGGRFKYLKGIVNMTTESSSIVVQVDGNYQITVTGSAIARSSGISDLQKADYDWNNLDKGNYLNNTGLGLDLGATFKPIDKLTLAASVTDLGYINWKNNTVQYTLDPATATYTFSGLDVNGLLNSSSPAGINLDAQLDSLEKKFTMKETPSGSYTTWLPTKFYLSGNYEVVKDLYIGTLFFGQSYKDRFSAGMTAAVTKNVGKWLNATLSYTVSNRSYNNIGAGVSFNLGPIQVYFVGDNLLAAPAYLVADQNLNSFVNNAQLLTLRTGINIVLGRDQGGISKAKIKDDSHNPKQKSSNAKVKNTYGRSPQKKK